MAMIGYARVSTKDQKLDLQIDALKAAGCEVIFTEQISSGVKERAELTKALAYLRSGDVFVVWKLDRLGRSLKELVLFINSFLEKGIEFFCINDNIDTTSPLGRCQFGIFAALAEFEREVIIERTKAGLQAARDRGRIGGRRKGLSKDAKAKAKMAKNAYETGELAILDICKLLDISKSTLYRYLIYENVTIKRNQ